MLTMLYSLEGISHYNMGNLKLAYRKMVQAAVERSIHPKLGKGHLLTAVAQHNLGCMLERCGQMAKAAEVLDSAADCLKQELGPTHPRAALAGRNLARVRQR